MFFSRVNELFNSIKIEIVIVSNNRAVPCMGLGFRLHLLSGDQQLFLIILHKYNYKYFYFINDMSSCKLYHDFILAPIKCQNKKQQQQKTTTTTTTNSRRRRKGSFPSFFAQPLRTTCALHFPFRPFFFKAWAPRRLESIDCIWRGFSILRRTITHLLQR